MHDPASAPTRRVLFIRRPKPGGVRVLCRLEPALDAVYARAVAPIAPAVEAALGGEVVANRVASASVVPPAVVLGAWRPERARFRVETARLSASGPVLRTDVAACYSSIAANAVAAALARCGVDRAGVLACLRVLEELSAEGVAGLPVGPPASAVLANAVLAAGDAALRELGLGFVRWVDDWWISVPSERRAGDALSALDDALGRVGLRLNAAKTRLGDEPGRAPSGAEYHRAADAHALSVLAGPHALVPGDGRVVARR